MYAIGDRVLYSTFGVAEIVDVTEQTFMDEAKKYYVLKEYASVSTSLTYVPVDSEALLSNMRPLLTKDEIISAVKNAKSSTLLEWIEDNKARAEYYKKVLATFDRVNIMRLIATVRKTGERREADGKKNYIADETVMKKAEKLIKTEFALVLGIDEGEVADFIEKI